MREKPGPNLELEILKLQLMEYYLAINIAIEDTIHKAKFNKMVPKDIRERASLEAEAFGGEALSFLRENLTSKLKPVHPSKEQVKMFQLLLDSVDNNNLLLKKTRVGLRRGKRPYVAKGYEYVDDQGNEIVQGLPSNLFTRREVRLGVIWGVDKDFPNGFSVHGLMGISCPGSIKFMTFPEKPETVEDVQKILQLPEKVGIFTTQVSVFGKGKRIIINWEGTNKGQEDGMTESHYLIGAFEGDGTKRTYWLYGHNYDDQSKMTVREKKGVTETATQTSRN